MFELDVHNYVPPEIGAAIPEPKIMEGEEITISATPEFWESIRLILLNRANALQQTAGDSLIFQINQLKEKLT